MIQISTRLCISQVWWSSKLVGKVIQYHRGEYLLSIISLREAIQDSNVLAECINVIGGHYFNIILNIWSTLKDQQSVTLQIRIFQAPGSHSGYVL